MSGTNLGKMPILIVSLVIGIVMATTAIVPLVSDYSDAKTFTNEGLYHMTEYDATLNTTVSWDHSSPNNITIGTDVISLATNTGSIPYTLICTEDFIVRYSASSVSLIQVWAESWGSSQYQAGTSAGTDMDITIAAGTVTLDNGSGTTKTYTYTDSLYMISVDGDYVMKNPSVSAYLNSDSQVIGAGRSSVSASVNFWITGNIDDGFTIENTYGDSTANITFSTLESTQTATDGYLDLYNFEKITFTATNTQTSTDYDVVYSQVIIPYQVDADPDNPAAYKALVKVVPVMAFVALIAAAAFMIYSKRD